MLFNPHDVMTIQTINLLVVLISLGFVCFVIGWLSATARERSWWRRAAAERVPMVIGDEEFRVCVNPRVNSWRWGWPSEPSTDGQRDICAGCLSATVGARACAVRDDLVKGSSLQKAVH